MLQTAYAEVGAECFQALSPAEEQRYLVAYVPLVKRIVGQLYAQATSIVARDDMEQVGLMGLLEALRRFGEPDAKFGTFAALRIRGAILDELRAHDWRPRSVRDDSHRHRDQVRALTRKLGREPTDSEIREALGLSTAAYVEYVEAQNAEEMASFDELVVDLVNTPSEMRTPEAQYLARRSLEQALMALDEREQRVIQLYYEYELSLKEIAAVLGLTEARVCQINKAALQKMKVFVQPS